MLNIVVSIFDVESEAYQAITELENSKGLVSSVMSEAVLVKKENGSYNILDGFNVESDVGRDAVYGGLIGMCVGILGGPVGMLLGAGFGALAGGGFDAANAAESVENKSMLEQIIGKFEIDTLAIVGLAYEENEGEIDGLLSQYKTTIVRFDAAVVEHEVEKAREMEKEMENLAKLEMRKQKKDEHKAKVEERRNKMKARFESLKVKQKKD